MKRLDFVLIVGVIGVILGAAASSFLILSSESLEIDTVGIEKPNSNNTTFTKLNYTKGIQKFSSSEELKTFLQNLQSNYAPFFSFYQGAPDDFILEESLMLERRPMELREAASGAVPEPEPEPRGMDQAKFTSAEGVEYSTTNIQVKNVDEPDFIKNDGNYLYILVGNELMIVDAYPAEDAEIVFESDFDIPNYHNFDDMFLNNDRLAIIYQDTIHKISFFDEPDQKRARVIQGPVTNVLILDVSDRSSPEIINEYSIDGWYHDSRMIADNVYVVTKDHLEYHHPLIPQIREDSRLSLLMPDVYYFDGMERPSEFTTISAIGLESDEISAETYLFGSSDTIFVSENNLYLTFQKHHPSHRVIFEKLVETGLLDSMTEPLSLEAQEAVKIISSDVSKPVEEKWQEISDILEEEYQSLSETQRAKAVISFERELRNLADKLQFDALRTMIHKIAIVDSEKVSFDYVASAEVLGHVLNQFSMDEYDGKFRIATSVQSFGWRASSMHNNVYIFDEDMDLVGSLEEIAPQERIYSARFMEDKLYLVTFRQIDPFFVIDLSGDVPKILGELKIPGFSSYLHPYGKDHVIGIGRDVGADGRVRSQNGGVKIAMFDISDFDKPKLKDQVIVGKSGTWSVGLDDHKAVLIDEGKKILSLPIRHEGYQMEPLVGIPEGDVIIRDEFMEPFPERILPNYDFWNGFYVYSIDEEKGFDELGKIRHDTSDYSNKARSLFIDDTLYTVTDHLLSINSLNDLGKTIKSIVLN